MNTDIVERLRTKPPVWEEMRYLSVCAGIEAASVAWHHMGWAPVAFSEIEKFPSAVLLSHRMAHATRHWATPWPCRS